jgi:hypothetical protein
MVKFRQVTVDGVVHGYVEDDELGVHIADTYVQVHSKRTGEVSRPLDRIPQGARRLDKEAGR